MNLHKDIIKIKNLLHIKDFRPCEIHPDSNRGGTINSFKTLNKKFVSSILTQFKKDNLEAGFFVGGKHDSIFYLAQRQNKKGQIYYPVNHISIKNSYECNREDLIAFVEFIAAENSKYKSK